MYGSVVRALGSRDSGGRDLQRTAAAVRAITVVWQAVHALEEAVAVARNGAVATSFQFILLNFEFASNTIIFTEVKVQYVQDRHESEPPPTHLSCHLIEFLSAQSTSCNIEIRAKTI